MEGCKRRREKGVRGGEQLEQLEQLERLYTMKPGVIMIHLNINININAMPSVRVSGTHPCLLSIINVDDARRWEPVRGSSSSGADLRQHIRLLSVLCASPGSER